MEILEHFYLLFDNMSCLENKKPLKFSALIAQLCIPVHLYEQPLGEYVVLYLIAAFAQLRFLQYSELIPSFIQMLMEN
jgi:hypothetical protein